MLQNGTIYAWKPKKETNAFELATTLGGDNGAVVSLSVGGGRLYSGSMDNTIRVGLISSFLYYYIIFLCRVVWKYVSLCFYINGVCFIISHFVKTAKLSKLYKVCGLEK